MSGGTLYASNGKEQFTSANPAIVQLANGADPTTGVLKIKIDSTDVQIPIQIQSRLTSVIQTHNNTLVAPNTWSKSSAWQDCSKFDKLAVHLLNDASTSSQVYVYWSFDQSTDHSYEQLMPVSTLLSRPGVTDVKAPYFKIGVQNGDTTTAHTMNSFTLLKS